ncbi:hypothetical protein CASFOL_015401 [Castilleja foliolosa]|uniref:Encoded peptide n=1 Tax=Castilleja foliolosa TaxID=1961234 RepID=A0ABD3DDZ5_9LAMI
MAKLILKNSQMFIFFVTLFLVCLETQFSEGRQEDKFINSQQEQVTGLTYKQDQHSNSIETLLTPPNEGSINKVSPTNPGHSPGIGHGRGHGRL